MKTKLRLLCLSAVALILVPGALAGHTHAPNSSWKLNAGASDFGQGPSMKSDLYVIHTDSDKWLTFEDTTVDGDGKTWKISWSGPQDGSPHPVKGMPGATYSSKTADDSSHFAFPDGTVEDTTLAMSGDKKRVTLTVDGKTKDGKSFHQTLIYDRVK
ncbi:MAG TPA: hypothetical protein VGN16_07760 [Acidobacteriaceae bacterium]|jgi:hypothetical protein